VGGDEQRENNARLAKTAVRRRPARRPAARRMPDHAPAQASGDAALASPELRWIYDTAPIGLAFLSPDCRYLQINQRLTDIRAHGGELWATPAEPHGTEFRFTVPIAAMNSPPVAPD
jgi:hypothetical protein